MLQGSGMSVYAGPLNSRFMPTIMAKGMKAVKDYAKRVAACDDAAVRSQLRFNASAFHADMSRGEREVYIDFSHDHMCLLSSRSAEKAIESMHALLEAEADDDDA